MPKTILEITPTHKKTWEVDDDIYEIVEKHGFKPITSFIKNCYDQELLDIIDSKIKLIKEEENKMDLTVGKSAFVFLDEFAIKDSIWDVYNRNPDKEFKNEIIGKWQIND